MNIEQSLANIWRLGVRSFIRMFGDAKCRERSIQPRWLAIRMADGIGQKTGYRPDVYFCLRCFAYHIETIDEGINK
jgi:hypothetical protein